MKQTYILKHINICYFNRIYQLQKANVYFESVEDMLEAMSPQIANLTKTTFRNYLIESGYAKRFITELLQAVTLVNYGQDINIPAFVGMILHFLLTCFSNIFFCQKVLLHLQVQDLSYGALKMEMFNFH